VERLKAGQWLGGETSEADALAHELGTLSQLLPHAARCCSSGIIHLFGVVDKVTACAVGAEADGVEGATRLRLVLWMPVEATHLVHAVRKLALGTVLARATLLVRAAQLSLVARGDGRGRGQRLWGGQRAGADAQAGRRHEACGGDGQRQGRLLGASQAADLSLDHADRSIHPKGNLVERVAGQLLLLVPLLVHGVDGPERGFANIAAAAAATAAAAAFETDVVEFGVW